MTATEWDYTTLAGSYDARADYAPEAIDWLLRHAGCLAGARVADIGAGTGKLTLPLLDRGLLVDAVEPNAAMRARGEANTAGRTVTWSEGTGERTGLARQRYDLVTFGSSFNVTDREQALVEARRIARPGGWFACLWNHRDLTDPAQLQVEALIVRHVPSFSRGVRREDQGPVLRRTGLLASIESVAFPFETRVPVAAYVEAWRSHATLARQAGGRFNDIVREIGVLFSGQAFIVVPYTTVMWAGPFR